MAHLLTSLTLAASSVHAEKAGASGRVGCLENPKLVQRLAITKPGVYENYLVDSQWEGGNRVKITADDVNLRNCEIRNATGNGVGIFGKNVTIENCRIHHMLAGSIKDQKDAHGITGHWGNTVIRNCEIFYTSGDSVQFDPERNSVGQALIEHCTFWTGPLPADAAGFKRGEVPGENAVDTKVRPGDAERCKLTIRDCYFHGWQPPGAIDMMAALNLKEHIAATVTNCVLANNQVAFRLRGPGPRGGAQVEVKDCAIYDGDIGVRMEDKIENLKITGLAFGAGVKQKYQEASKGPGPGYVNEGEHEAPPIAEVIVTSP
ncbi:MAG: right-handed parallel beta-helix repeat-containing protein [Prosthecobacter sp.]|nr:right-handed parallel beta-helix repeat-containing protein [Prosthecobacter sp.]